MLNLAKSRNQRSSHQTLSYCKILGSSYSYVSSRITKIHVPTVCSSTQVGAKLSKSAIKKANRLSRIERKQRLKRQSQPTGKESDAQERATIPSEPQYARFTEVDEIELSQPQLVDPRGILEAKPPDEVNGLSEEKAQPIESHLHLNADNHPAGATPLSEPQRRNNTIPNVEMIPVSTNGSVAQDIHKDELPNAQVVEQAKKRQNVLTRTLWTFIMITGFLGEPNCIIVGPVT